MFTINPNASVCYNPTTLSWNKSTDCCSWKGVHCEEMTGQVIELDLTCSGLQGKFHANSSSPNSNGGLTGVIPPEISHLYSVNISSTIPLNFSSYLTTLQLSGAQLRGVLPERVFHLSNLEHLELSYNSLTGPIPSNEFKSKSLYSVDLKQNQLQGPIPKSLLDLQGLFSLRISQNNQSGQIASTVCNLKTLRVLDLGSNHLSRTIPHCLGESSAIVDQLQSLEFLDLGDNQLNDTFPSWLGGLPDLQILSLRSNKLYGPIKESRTDNFLAKIRVIDLSSNGFGGDLPGLDLELPRVLTTEVIINLSRNRFEGYLPSIIGDLVGLRTLNLSHNGLEGVIPESLHQLSILESLDFSSNKIGGEIPQQLVSLTSLEVLNLSHNHLVGCIPKGKQFDTFDNSLYLGNDGLRGLPLSKDWGGDDGVPQATTPVELDDEEEDEGDLISWQAVLMGFGCGLVIGLSIIYIMLSTHYPVWFSRMVVKFEHKSDSIMKRHKKRY
ncbi:putative poly(A) polymerase-like [Capsicum annuum]|nr:putative poly(A) polymerase-like [Capsicum annuum]